MNISPSSVDSSLTRITASRKALLRQMAGGSEKPITDRTNEFNNVGDGQTDIQQQGSGSSMWQVLAQAFRAWWQHHPVQVAFDIGKPFLSKYAQDKPLWLLGVAAGVGAAAVVVKPWRLVSVTGLALALFKSPKLSNTLLSLLPNLSASQRFRKSQQQLQKDRP